MDDKVRACTYCGLTYGSQVHFKDGRVKILQEVDDHFYPRSHGETKEGNIVSCCDMCNGLKTDKVFDTVEQVRSYVSQVYDNVIERTILHSPSLVKDLKKVIIEAKKQINSVRVLPPVQVDVPAEREVLLDGVQGSSVSREEGYPRYEPGFCTEQEGQVDHRFVRDNGTRCFYCNEPNKVLLWALKFRALKLQYGTRSRSSSV